MKTNALLEASQNNAKPTQGNWTYSKYSTDFAVYSENLDGRDIALVREYGSVEQAEANAKLIAAAPDLLAALILANNILNRMSDEYSAIANKHANFTRGESNVIERAINKATK